MKRRFPSAVLVLLAIQSLGASCGNKDGAASTAPSGAQGAAAAPAGERVESLASVDVSSLTDRERSQWVDLINDRLSPCGEPVSVGRCVAEERKCGTCVSAARYLARLITEGYEQKEIEEFYEGRYGAASAVDLKVDRAPSRGAAMAPVTIVEFSDFQCPYCGRAHPIVQDILRKFEGQVRVVFLNYPLDGHPDALPAARAVVAAGLQGKFWEMHDHLFEHQTALDRASLLAYAKELGLDMAKFEADFESEAVQAAVEADKALGKKVGVAGTPTFVVNGRLFGESPQQLPDYIAEELDR
ncbi:MAG: thioredoxin domain-containing protein [Myxococcales bacterium]|nr:thioredoxin domain-containing protein [Myxococcales bacterium]